MWDRVHAGSTACSGVRFSMDHKVSMEWALEHRILPQWPVRSCDSLTGSAVAVAVSGLCRHPQRHVGLQVSHALEGFHVQVP